MWIDFKSIIGIEKQKFLMKKLSLLKKNYYKKILFKKNNDGKTILLVLLFSSISLNNFFIPYIIFL